MPSSTQATAAADALLRRYLEAHGTWRDEVHRTGAAGTVTSRVLVPCDCAVCADTRAHLKLEA